MTWRLHRKLKKCFDIIGERCEVQFFTFVLFTDLISTFIWKGMSKYFSFHKVFTRLSWQLWLLLKSLLSPQIFWESEQKRGCSFTSFCHEIYLNNNHSASEKSLSVSEVEFFKVICLFTRSSAVSSSYGIFHQMEKRPELYNWCKVWQWSNTGTSSPAAGQKVILAIWYFKTCWLVASFSSCQTITAWTDCTSLTYSTIFTVFIQRSRSAGKILETCLENNW